PCRMPVPVSQGHRRGSPDAPHAGRWPAYPGRHGGSRTIVADGPVGGSFGRFARRLDVGQVQRTYGSGVERKAAARTHSWPRSSALPPSLRHQRRFVSIDNGRSKSSVHSTGGETTNQTRSRSISTVHVALQTTAV